MALMQTEKTRAEPSRRRKWADNVSSKLGIHRIKRSKKPQQPSIAATLPDDILCAIFDFLPTVRTNPQYYWVNDYRTDLKRLTLVCRAWYPAATSLLYRHIQIIGIYYLPRLIKQLRRKPHLRTLVKSLVLPARPGADMPFSIQMLYLDVVNLIEDLHHLTIMAPMVNKAKDGQNQLVSQIADGKHSSLRSLSVYADVLSISSSPHLLFAPFTHLEYLALHYVYFTESSLDSVSIEILPRLQHFEFTGGECVWVLDEWLQACPNLEHLTLQNTNLADAPSQPPLQLMTMDKLKRLDLLYMPKYSQSGPYSFAWLQECGSISHLAIDYDILTSLYDEGGHLHLGDLLTLQLPFDYEGDFDTTISLPFERDSKGNDTMSPTASSDIPCKIKFQAECRHQPWYCANEKRFQEYEGGRFNFSFQVDLCGCIEDGSGLYRGLMQFAVYIGVVKGWPVLKRLMDRETREMSLWQYPTLKALVEP